jgi:AcrR family transcriptional regulator
MSTRDQILDATTEVITRLGLARATTKEIARAAGFSEATIYKHFQGKDELVLTVLYERLPPLIPLLEELPRRAGTDTVAAILTEVATTALSFYEAGTPMMASLFAEQELLVRHRDGMKDSGLGPHLANKAVAAYVRAEQRLGRIDDGVDPDSVGALLLGACFQRSFFRHLVGDRAAPQSAARFVREIVRTLTGPLS